MDAKRTAILFPGQGAQSLGMGRWLCDQFAVAREVYARAAEILDYDLAALCWDGPAEKLNATEFSQPALFVSSMAAVEVLRSEQPERLQGVVAAAGLSLGEYTAVCFAEGLDFDNSLRLVQRRGQAMQQAADRVAGGMASVLGLDLEQVDALCRQVRIEGEILQPANLLCPGNIAVSGHRTALARLEEAAVQAGASRVIALPVAGAFHTPLMQPAVESLTAALAEMPLRDTRVPVYSNVDGLPHREADAIRQLLARQVVSPVCWEESLRRMLADGIDGFLEVGTGRVLRGTLKRIDRKVAADGFGDGP